MRSKPRDVRLCLDLDHSDEAIYIDGVRTVVSADACYASDLAGECSGETFTIRQHEVRLGEERKWPENFSNLVFADGEEFALEG